MIFCDVRANQISEANEASDTSRSAIFIPDGLYVNTTLWFPDDSIFIAV